MTRFRVTVAALGASPSVEELKAVLSHLEPAAGDTAGQVVLTVSAVDVGAAEMYLRRLLVREALAGRVDVVRVEPADGSFR